LAAPCSKSQVRNQTRTPRNGDSIAFGFIAVTLAASTTRLSSASQLSWSGLPHRMCGGRQVEVLLLLSRWRVADHVEQMFRQPSRFSVSSDCTSFRQHSFSRPTPRMDAHRSFCRPFDL